MASLESHKVFDKSKLPTDYTKEIVTEVNSVIERLRALLVPRIIVSEPPLGLTVPNLVRTFLQSHTRRLLNFIDGGLAEIEVGRPLVAELCTRAIYESTATVCDFAKQFMPLADKGDYKGISDLVTDFAFATRIPSFLEKGGSKAPQILNQIDEMKKRYPGYRETYDHLSDIAHPNGLGCVVYFTERAADDSIIFSDGGTPSSAERALQSLFGAAVFTAYFEASITEIEAALKKLTQDIIVKALIQYADELQSQPKAE